MTKAKNGTRRYFLIKFCIFLSGLSVFAQLYLFQPLLPQVAHYFHTSIGSSSFLVSASTIGMALGLFYFTFNADHYSRKKVMVFALVASAVLTMSSSYIHQLPLLVGIGILKGFVVSGVSAVALVYIMEEVDSSYTGSAVGLYLSGNIIGGMTGRILATLIADRWAWQAAVMTIGIESFILGIVFWKLFPESHFFRPVKMNYKKKIHQMKNFLKDPYLRCLFFMAALLMGVFVSIYNYISFRLENAPFHLPAYIIAFIFVMYIMGVVGTLITHRLYKRYSAAMVLSMAMLLLFAGVLLLLSVYLSLVILGLGLLTMAFFIVHTMASQLVAKHAKEGKSSATSIYWLFYYLGSSILGSATGYFLHDLNWIDFIVLLVSIIVIAFVLILGIRKKNRSKRIHFAFYKNNKYKSYKPG